MMRGIIGQTILVRVVLALAFQRRRLRRNRFAGRNSISPKPARRGHPAFGFYRGRRQAGWIRTEFSNRGRAGRFDRSIDVQRRRRYACAVSGEKHPPSRIVYKRITPRFFVVSTSRTIRSGTTLQLCLPLHPLRADQLSSEREARLGWHRDPDHNTLTGG